MTYTCRLYILEYATRVFYVNHCSSFIVYFYTNRFCKSNGGKERKCTMNEEWWINGFLSWELRRRFMTLSCPNQTFSWRSLVELIDLHEFIYTQGCLKGNQDEKKEEKIKIRITEDQKKHLLILGGQNHIYGINSSPSIQLILQSWNLSLKSQFFWIELEL